MAAMISARGPAAEVERVAHARAEAQRETYDRLAHEFADKRCAALDGLLATDPEIGMTRLRWLATGRSSASWSANPPSRTGRSRRWRTSWVRRWAS
ncbi:hypothetical protein [Amycolatopsis sp. NPDC052450]|uniref:hypothetical protein n=1 Tax=Amycolatopsis sp. NPDC052450 TaxID=3363937 RepID=UPI0037CAD8F0